MNKTTDAIETLRADLLELATYAAENPHDARTRESVSRALSALVLHGASPAEFRGVSDAGLTDDELNLVLAGLPATGMWTTAILAELDDDARGRLEIRP